MLPDKKQITTSLRNIGTHRYFPILLLIAINICVGVWIVGDYGESWDEANNKIYGEQSLEAYSWWLNKDLELGEYLGPTNQRFRGPIYPMLATLFVSLMQAIHKDWFSYDLWHYANFLCFQLGVFFFYMICIRYVKPLAGMGAALLFVTQPLLWGHAFINSKDIPLMVFSLGSIAIGLAMVDAYQRTPKQHDVKQEKPFSYTKNLRIRVIQDWRVTRSLAKNTLVFLAGVLSVIFLTKRFLQCLVEAIITKSYYADPTSFLGNLFSRLATEARTVPLEAYLRKGIILYERMMLSATILLISLILLLTIRIFRNSLVEIWQRIRLAWSVSAHTWLLILAAAMMLGLSVSTRTGGIFSGGLISIYFLVKTGKKSIPALIVYFSIAFLVSYITWPYLWQNPMGNFLESLAASSNFEQSPSILFQGTRYPADALPPNYLPVLMALQFSEPAIFLAIAGVILIVIKIIRHHDRWMESSLMLAWFFVPFIMVIIFRPTMYDNFRHWLFILPPIFVFAGCALEALFKLITPKIVKLLVILMILVPGIYWGVNLHPYQYIYYNTFVGNVDGAFRKYELDYWVISYREATLFLNNNAPPDSKILVVGPRRIFMTYARQDLNQGWFRVEQVEETTESVYVIIMTRFDRDLSLFTDGKVIYTVNRDGADLTVVKQLK